MTPSHTDNDTFLLFFHGLDSSNQTSKFTCITHEPKYCQTVNYRENFKDAFVIYDELIQKNLKKYPQVVLAGHSLGGWFANHFAHKYNLRALLIAPCINPSEVLADRIIEVADMDLPFLTSNPAMTRVMIEIADERLEVTVARHTLKEVPESWKVEYYEGGHHRIARENEINHNLSELCEDKID